MTIRYSAPRIIPGVRAIAVVAAWGGQHPAWAGEALASIEGQRPAADERVLVIDHPHGLDLLSRLPRDPRNHGWTVLHGDWRDPGQARNLGLSRTTSRWVVFFDADNLMAPGHLDAVGRAVRSALPRVGVVYHDIRYVTADLGDSGLWRVPDYDYWSLRASNFIDTSSAWRREAVELAGGWPVGCGSFEDYALALAVTRRGWVAQRRDGPPVTMRQHDHSRSHTRVRTGDRRTDLWRTRTLGIVSLLAGRHSTFGRWAEFLTHAELPPHTSLYVIDNSGDPEFGTLVRSTCERLAVDRRLDHLTVLPRPHRYGGTPDEPYFVRERHLHIARLYSEVMPTIREDLVLTLEDDVEPPLDAVRRLGEQIGCTPWGRYAAVAGAYDMGADGGLCAGRADGGWGSPIHWRDLGDGPMDVGSVGGGCTMWANWALVEQPIPFMWYDGLGWDGSLCNRLRQNGFGIQLHGGVRCTHHVHGAIRS